MKLWIITMILAITSAATIKEEIEEKANSIGQSVKLNAHEMRVILGAGIVWYLTKKPLVAVVYAYVAYYLLSEPRFTCSWHVLALGTAWSLQKRQAGYIILGIAAILYATRQSIL